MFELDISLDRIRVHRTTMFTLASNLHSTAKYDVIAKRVPVLLVLAQTKVTTASVTKFGSESSCRSVSSWL